MLIYNRISINFEVFIMNVCAIILAAGRGSRMKSTRHKATHKICGKEMINIIIDKLEKYISFFCMMYNLSLLCTPIAYRNISLLKRSITHIFPLFLPLSRHLEKEAKFRTLIG